MFKTIVVGVDGREGGRDALALASRLALVAGGKVVAARVLPFEYYISHAGAPPYASIAERDAKRDLAADLASAAVTGRCVVVGDSSAARGLHRVAEAQGADLIVVGSTRHGAAGRVLAGDDAASTLHGSSCSVAVAPRGLAAADSRAVRTIGVGYDGTPDARRALDLAVGLARSCGASLVARSVVSAPIPSAGPMAYDRDRLEEAKELAARELAEAVADLPVEVTGEVLVGPPVDALVALSAEVDLLVVGSRGWGPVLRTVLGSTAAKVVRRAHAPVLVLPRGATTERPGARARGGHRATKAPA